MNRNPKGPLYRVAQVAFLGTSPIVGLLAGYFLLRALGVDLLDMQGDGERKNQAAGARAKPGDGPRKTALRDSTSGQATATAKNADRKSGRADLHPAVVHPPRVNAKAPPEGALPAMPVAAPAQLIGIADYGPLKLPDGRKLDRELLGIGWAQIDKDLPSQAEAAYRPDDRGSVFESSGGRLNGVALTCYAKATPMMHGQFKGGQRQGAFRLWDDQQNLVLYSEFSTGKLDGVTCLLASQRPRMVTVYKDARVQRRYYVRRGDLLTLIESTELVPGSPEAQELKADEDRVKEIMSLMGAGQSSLEDSVADWYQERRDAQDGKLSKEQRMARAQQRRDRSQKRSAARKAQSDAAMQALWGRALRQSGF